MLKHVINWSIKNRFLVLIATFILAGWGLIAIKNAPLDAIPDLSDVQVIIKTSYPGQSPRVVEDQVTYPITTTMLAVPGAQTVRAYSFFGESYVYVIFADGTDIYWARSRVLEYLNQAIASLPDGVQPALGPDATGVGWIFSYALVDRTGQHDISQLRTLQDWFLKFELQTVHGVAEVATAGGAVKQYQIVVDPDKLRIYNIPLSQVIAAVKNANQEVGGSVIEWAEAEYMIRSRGYLQGIEDIEQIALSVTRSGTPIRLSDVAVVQIGPEMRRIVTDLDGDGEVTGGIVVMRHGENALATIRRVQDKLDELKYSLPEGVEIVTTYDRSGLILRAVENLQQKLIEELIVVALVCLIFLFHLRSALIAIISLPLGIMTAFIIMNAQGINANIMSLGGIAIAIGAMVDAAIVMIENAHKHLERWQLQNPHRTISTEEHWQVINRAANEVGPALFFSLLIITLSFIPVFALEAQEGRLFSPLAFTKTYAMAAAAGLAVTLIPVLMGYFIRGHIPKEDSNPLNRLLIAIYRPFLQLVLMLPRTTLFIAFLIFCSILIPISGLKGLFEPLRWPIQMSQMIWDEPAAHSLREKWLSQVDFWQQETTHFWQNQFADHPLLGRFENGLGSEFMPELFEGDLMYMPTTLPGIGIGKAQELLQQTNRLIASFPEVKSVFGKMGSADTATDPAPLNMVETLIQLHPPELWREGMTLARLIEELDHVVNIPGVTNAWVMPIKTRIDMLATGIKTPLGVKISGADLDVIQDIGQELERILMALPGTRSAYSERVVDGRYIEIIPDRVAAARLGLNVNEINELISIAVGGMTITQTVEGRERYPVSIRFPRELRDSFDTLARLPLVLPNGMHVPLDQIAEIKITSGAPMLTSENARLNGWTFVDISPEIDLGRYIEMAQQHVRESLSLPAGYSLVWSGQYEYMLRVKERLKQVLPLTLMIIFILLYLTFNRIREAILVMVTLPFALVGGFWLIYILGFNWSVAVAVGFIALAGVAAEFGVIMLVYLDNALKQYQAENRLYTNTQLKAAIMEGAVLRVRPKAMTVLTLIVGLIPIFLTEGTGSEVMQRIAAPMIGGMITAPLLSLFVMPALYLLWKQPVVKKNAAERWPAVVG